MSTDVPPPAPAEPEREYGPDSVMRDYEAAYGWRGGAPPPPRFSSGTPGKGGLPPWARVLLIGCLVTLGGCGALVWYGMSQLGRSGAVRGVPPAQVLTGTPIQWQELDKWPPLGHGVSAVPGYGGTLHGGNFDANLQPELLVLRPVSTGSHSAAGTPDVKVYNLSGRPRPVQLGHNNLTTQALAWDYDGDGRLEIVTAMPTVEVYDGFGKHIRSLSGNLTPGALSSQADVNGDGHLDLVLEDPMSGGLMALGLNGSRFWKDPAAATGLAWGNVDADKPAEQIETAGQSGLLCTDMMGQITALSSWPSGGNLNAGGGMGYSRLYCADITGDGLDEVIDPLAGYLDTKTGKYIALKHPVQQTPSPYSMTLTTTAVLAGDFDGEGTRELAVSDSGGSSGYPLAMGTALLIYRADGSLKYNEEFGGQLHGLTSVRDGKRDRLAVLLDDRLLLAP